MQRRQVLASGCTAATSAAEARYRIQATIDDRRSTAVFALDPRAQVIVDASRHGHSDRVRFMVCTGATESNGNVPPTAGNGHHPSVPAAASVFPIGDSRTSPVPLPDVVADADLVVMVATSPDARPGAAMVGDWCAQQRIMTAGLAVVGDEVGENVADGVAAVLRPYSEMLLITEDAGDLDEILTALRA